MRAPVVKVDLRDDLVETERAELAVHDRGPRSTLDVAPEPRLVPEAEDAALAGRHVEFGDRARDWPMSPAG